ncbi:SpoIIE family protein phosphatase [Yinghuangia aomiensis]
MVRRFQAPGRPHRDRRRRRDRQGPDRGRRNGPGPRRAARPRLHRPRSGRGALTGLDRLFTATEDDESLTTLIYGVIDPATGVFDLADAGHLPVLIVSADGSKPSSPTRARRPPRWASSSRAPSTRCGWTPATSWSVSPTG